MSMAATVSRLDSFRYWRGNEAATTEDWLNDLNAPPNHRMDVGAAFQAVLENLSAGDEFSTCEADGISFNFKCDAAIPQIRPTHGRKDYGNVFVSGKAGIVDGKRVEVFKTTKRFEAEKCQDDYQWRLYLDLFDADEFVWNIFVIAPTNPEETSYDVVDYHRLTATRYPGLHADCVSLINDYHDIMSSIPEEDMFMASIGRGQAKALPREVEIYTIHGDIIQETEDAILVDCGVEKPVWLGKSQIEYSGARDDIDVEIHLPDWMAKNEGLPDGQRKTRATPAAETDAAAAQADAPADEAPISCHFKADVTEISADSLTLLVTTKRGKEQHFTYLKKNLRFEGDDVADLQVGYKGIDFVIDWDIAVESGLAKFLRLKAPKPAPEAAPQEQQAAAAPAEQEAAPAADEDEAPKQEAKPYKSKLRSEMITDYVKLTDTELANYGKDMSEAMTRRTEHKETAAHYSRLSRDAEKAAYKLNDIIQAGHEEREIHCDVIGDFNTGEIVYVESEYPHREIRRQPMTEKDRQLLLPIDPPEQPQPEPEAAAQPAEPESAEAPAEPAQEFVTLFGVRNFDKDTDNDIHFEVHYGDEEDTIVEFFVPKDSVIGEGQDTDYPDDDSRRYIEMDVARAVELGIIEAPEDATAPEHDCTTCKHGHDGEEQLCMRPEQGVACDNFSQWEQAEEEKGCASCTHRDVEGDTACTECNDELSSFAPISPADQPDQGATAGGVQ